MKKLLFSLYLLLNALIAPAQSLGGYPISDFLVSAVHPNGCNQNYVTGPPDDLTWVNFNDGDIMSGNFGTTWIDAPGNELLLETSYHADNYAVRLKLSTGLYSSIYNVLVANWTQITDTTWIHLFTSCTFGTQGVTRFIMPLDFNLHFGLSPTDIVTGIEITFLATPGAPDLSGVYIISNQPCNLNLGNDTSLCQGDTLVVNATLANSTYLWQNNSTNQAFTVTQAGTYWVTATNNTCTVTDTIVVNYNPLPTVSLGVDSTLCQGETLTLDATTLNATYLWQNNTTNASYNVSTPGTFWVNINVNNCTATDTVIVNFNPLPSVNLGLDTVLCQGETLTLDATTLNASYQWQNNSTNPSFAVTTSGTYWVKINVNNCTETDSIIVNFNSLPSVDLGIDTALCQGETLTLDATTLNAAYLWQNNSNNPTYNVSMPGTYWATVTVNNCSATDSIMVNYNTYPIVSLGVDSTLCTGEILTLDATTLNATYQWQNNSTASSFNVSQQGVHWVKVTVNNCTTIDSINVYYNPTPIVNLGVDTTLCFGSNLLLNATNPNASYQWNDGSSTSTYTVSDSGTYWVKITMNNCTAMDSIHVNFHPFFSIDLGNDTLLCYGEVITLDATTPNATYQWQSNSTNPTYTVTQVGTYWVTVTVNNCSIMDSVSVSFNPLPSINFSNDTIICLGQSLLLNATSFNSSYLWQDNSTNPTFTVTEQGTYWVEVKNKCWTYFDTSIVVVKNCDCTFYVPTAFTPEGNNSNDRFAPVSDCNFTEYHFMIFNRWGEKLFETNSSIESWDGTYKGEIAPIGVYIYSVTYNFEDEVRTNSKGLIHLLR